MVNSILNTIKQMFGLPVADTAFDQDILVHINSAFMALNQLGVGPATVFSITDSTTTWADFTSEIDTYSQVKSYMYLYVKMLFDPPSSSFILSAIKEEIQKIEWRLSVQVPIITE